MGLKTKLQKTKKKLKKTKAKLKSLKEVNQNLQEQLKLMSEQIPHKESLSPEIVHSKLSKDIAAKQAISLFQTITDSEVLEAFIKGETRPSVVERAQYRINAIRKSQATG